MCGIVGILDIKGNGIKDLEHLLDVLNTLQVHRGPDGEGKWLGKKKQVGLAHRRLSIIDLSTGDQPMVSKNGNIIVFNGEIYNYIELKEKLKGFYKFKTNSDTEVILASYERWGNKCVEHFKGMFSFAIWNNEKKELYCARDRFGIKPFYYLKSNQRFIFASEIKALLPFVDIIKTNLNALKEFLIFQVLLTEHTLFKGVQRLLPGHYLVVKNGRVEISKYWDIEYKLDWSHTEKYFQDRLRDLFEESISLHLRSDVPVGSYLSGGIDSSLVTILARRTKTKGVFKSFNGRFSGGRLYDESRYAEIVARENKLKLFEIDISANDFIKNISKVIYHLDYPVAGPGSFPQYMVSKAASKHLKVVLGGQGGDEIFGGYARYLIAYFEQCIKGAIKGTINSGNFIVTYESIIPNLVSLREYIPTIREFWGEGLFENRDKRYFRLINRANSLKDEINWSLLEGHSVFEAFQDIYWRSNVEKESYFDSMTHFDFKTLLPALLQVEDRMSMAHGLESRVPMLYEPLVEFVASVPSNIKFANGSLKNMLKTTFKEIIPKPILERKDKMGFPVPLSDWYSKDKHFRDYINDTFCGHKSKTREYLNPSFDPKTLINKNNKFNRKMWGLFSLELWQQQFHDKETVFKNMLKS